MEVQEERQLASAAQAHGRLDEAVAICSRIIEREPKQADVMLQLAGLEKARGQIQTATAWAERVAELKSANPQVRHDLALLFSELGKPEAAVSQMREAARLQPRSPEILNNLGELLLPLRKIDQALEAYRQAIALAPDDALLHSNLGRTLRTAGRFSDAIAALRIAATLDPNLPDAWAGLGATLVESGAARAALGALRRAIELCPEDDRSCHQLGNALHALREFAESVEFHERAIRLNPNRTDYFYAMARAQMDWGRKTQAIATLQRCLTLDANYAPAIHEMGKALFEFGCVEKAMSLLRQAVNVPSDELRTQMLMNLAIIVPGSPADDNRTILETRQAYAARLPTRHRRAARPASKILRIGYVSSFFHWRNWMKPVWPLINHHDRTRFQIHLFSDAPAEQCQYGYRADPRDRFHDITGQSNEAAAKKIAEQNIDVIIDLNGYSAPQRLGLFPLRPAPIQAAWFNMYATSGMKCFDFLIGDECVIPADEEPFYTERIVRVPHCYLAFQVDYAVPEIAGQPVCKTGQVTIGCLASQYKITDEVLQTWSAILQRCSARLLIRNGMLDRPEHMDHLIARCTNAGIPRDRLQLEGRAEHFEFLATYDRIDFAVDTFPYSGGTTTTEALWQGVPVVTFMGDRWVSRTSASLLKAAGLDEFVADSRQGYIDLCVHLATSADTPARLSTFRSNIRQQLRNAPVCDIQSLARAIEYLYLQMRPSLG